MAVKRAVFFGLLLVFIAGGIGIGWVGVRGSKELSAIQADIDKELVKRENAKAERDELAASQDVEKKRLAELPDSLQKMKGAQALKSSLSFAKLETILDSKELRIKKRLEFLESKKSEAKGRLYRDTAMLAVIEAVLFVALIVARRRLNRSRILSV